MTRLLPAVVDVVNAAGENTIHRPLPPAVVVVPESVIVPVVLMEVIDWPPSPPPPPINSPQNNLSVLGTGIVVAPDAHVPVAASTPWPYKVTVPDRS